MDAPEGLRERKKAAARLALHEAAVRLALEHGLDHVTTEAIADAADLSRRTFSNYFASKEDAILDGDVVRLQDWLAALRDRPPSEPPWRALRASLNSLTDRWLDPDLARVTAMRALRQHPSLLARQSAIYGAFERDAAGVLLARSGAHAPDDRRAARVQAAAFLSGLRVAMNLWVEEPDVHHLMPTLDQVLDQLGRGFE
ncbi:TetR/AcrR family transcriptional regulator [Cryptosporangium phraense]|uniref:TetR/AcrR family transcriptional regulator n=1 Tax=Cryptosporangium phraense TaxID=2593070 RepID=UPI00197A88AD|nr:TetR/AcrR family transcriptional regulator [Cryptosporangium phraense]